MSRYQSKIFDNKIIIGVKDQIAETIDDLFQSTLFRQFLERFLDRLEKRDSPLLGIFEHNPPSSDEREILYKTLLYLTKLEWQLVPNVVPGSASLFHQRALLNEFVEQFYNYWRSFDRFVICDSTEENFDRRPYRTFRATVERLMHLVRQAYRDIQENITAQHPRVYRQVHAGAGVATIVTMPRHKHFSVEYAFLNDIAMIRQVLIFPPLILNPPMNKRQGVFTELPTNPLQGYSLNPVEWLCYPAKVGPLIIYVYLHENFYDLGFALCNLFEIASDRDLERKPDAIYLYGMDPAHLQQVSEQPTVFYEDQDNDLFIGVVPNEPRFGYFGYLKKMVLTLHNLKIIQQSRLPFHGACVRIKLKNSHQANILLIGDTGAGKSETLEALRQLGDEYIKEMTVIADDMGSLAIAQHQLVAYGTEIGAFVRLDDLQPGYAFGQLDRAIIMNAGQINARLVLPVTTYDQVVEGVSIDYILYANNYENVDPEHPVIERFTDLEEAWWVFREGTVMSKGTTTSTGLVHTYFANIFGPVQRRQRHDEIARRFFQHCFQNGIFVGQMRTRLGITGFELAGPRAAAQELMQLLLTDCR
jgi:energy-coupling factor transporter ATP-binding protein EcfA2